MSKKAKDIIKSWFLTGLYPTQSQFHDWMDSYWHKDESIPSSNVDGLNESLNNKAEKSVLKQVINDLKTAMSDFQTRLSSIKLPTVAQTIEGAIDEVAAGLGIIGNSVTVNTNNIHSLYDLVNESSNGLALSYDKEIINATIWNVNKLMPGKKFASAADAYAAVAAITDINSVLGSIVVFTDTTNELRACILNQLTGTPVLSLPSDTASMLANYNSLVFFNANSGGATTIRCYAYSIVSGKVFDINDSSDVPSEYWDKYAINTSKNELLIVSGNCSQEFYIIKNGVKRLYKLPNAYWCSPIYYYGNYYVCLSSTHGRTSAESVYDVYLSIIDSEHGIHNFLVDGMNSQYEQNTRMFIIDSHVCFMSYDQKIMGCIDLSSLNIEGLNYTEDGVTDSARISCTETDTSILTSVSDSDGAIYSVAFSNQYVKVTKTHVYLFNAVTTAEAYVLDAASFKVISMSINKHNNAIAVVDCIVSASSTRNVVYGSDMANLIANIKAGTGILVQNTNSDSATHSMDSVILNDDGEFVLYDSTARTLTYYDKNGTKVSKFGQDANWENLSDYLGSGGGGDTHYKGEVSFTQFSSLLASELSNQDYYLVAPDNSNEIAVQTINGIAVFTTPFYAKYVKVDADTTAGTSAIEGWAIQSHSTETLSSIQPFPYLDANTTGTFITSTNTSNSFALAVITDFKVRTNYVKIFVAQNGNKNLRFAIYDENLKLIVQTDIYTGSAIGFVKIPFQSIVTLKEDTLYYLAFGVSANGTTFVGKNLPFSINNTCQTLYSDQNALGADLTYPATYGGTKRGEATFIPYFKIL